MQCGECKFWHLPTEAEGDGTGLPYDAGHMNYCNHPQVTGVQHPSFGACGEPKTMVYAGGETQLIMTRSNYGCVLFDHYKLYSTQPVSSKRK